MHHDGYGLDYVDARCHICDARFDSVAGLEEHLDEHLTDRNPFDTLRENPFVEEGAR
jgi:hypothetical protein